VIGLGRWLAVVSTLATLVIGVSALSQAKPEDVGLDARVLAQATELLTQFVADRKIAGAVAAVARKGRLAYLESVGVQDLETRAPMSERSLFRIYSMAKPVTAVAAMILYEEGKFRLDDPVSKYIPEFSKVVVYAEPGGATRPPAQPVTVKDLLLHTSGLSHRTSDLYRSEKVRSRRDTLPRFITNVVRVPLMEDPGTRFRYSEATTVVGRLVEIWSGQPFDAFLEQRLFRPLGMSDTAFWVSADKRARLATVYTPAPGGGIAPIEIEEVPFTERPALLEGAVGLVSTVPDFMRFSQMLLNKGELEGRRVLRATTVEQMTANGLSAAIQQARGGAMGWGLANVNIALDGPLEGEYGWDGTAGTIFWIDPAREVICILMTQSSPANPDRLRQRFKAVVDQAVIAPRAPF
jgi:CubicO group peptidase (beta-lactamase class C family)